MKHSRLVLTTLILLAFALRVHQVAQASFWFDEADAVRMASLEPRELLQLLTKEGTNGPLYFVLLRIWMLAAGQSEFALRFLSSAAGILLIPLLFVVGRRLLNPRAGLIAAFLASISSYLVFYSQDAKMYSWFAFASLLSIHLLLRSISENRWRDWMAFVATTTIAFYLHVYGIMLVPAAFILVMTQLRRTQMSLSKPASAFAILTLPYLPLAVWHWDLITSPFFRVQMYGSNMGLVGIVREVLLRFTTRYADVPDWLILGPFGALLLAGVLPQGRKLTSSEGRRSLLLALFLLVPVIISYALVWRTGVFGDRYMILVLPVYYLAISIGLERTTRIHRAFPLMFLTLFTVVNAPPILDKQLNLSPQREDWRGAVAFIEDRSLDDDRFLFLAPEMRAPYSYYARKPFSTISLEVQSLRLGETAFMPSLLKGLAPDQRLWVILSYNGRQEGETLLASLNKHMQVSLWQGFSNVAIFRFVSKPPLSIEKPPMETTTGIDFENRLRLLGFSARRPLPGREGIAIYSLYWEALMNPLDRYVVSTRIVDEDGLVWGGADWEPGGGFYPTSTWQAGQILQDDREISFVPGTPPGRYYLSTRVYARSNLQELSILAAGGVRSGTEARIAQLDLKSSTGEVSTFRTGDNPVATFDGSIALDRVEVEGDRLNPGEPFLLTTQWRAISQIRDTFVSKVFLVDRLGSTAAQWTTPLVNDANPPTSWIVGSQITGKRRLYVPASVPAGSYSVQLSVQGSSGRLLSTGTWFNPWAGDRIELGKVQVTAREHLFERPPLARQIDVLFPNYTRLAGYEVKVSGQKVDPSAGPVLVSPGQTLEAALLWRGEGAVDRGLTAFVHLLDRSGRVQAQNDALPCEGDCPSRSWVMGEYLIDRHRIELPKDIPPGEYRIEVGLYDSHTGERLVSSAGEKQAFLDLAVEVSR